MYAYVIESTYSSKLFGIQVTISSHNAPIVCLAVQGLLAYIHNARFAFEQLKKK